jgi:hypothetical protein
VLCQECCDEIVGPRPIASEQVISVAPHPTDAALVDGCGNLHRLACDVDIGREPTSSGVQVLDASVSRRHAQIAFDNTRWTVVDLASKNGTTLDDEAVREVPRPIRDGARIRVGFVGFYFIECTAGMAARRFERAGSETTPTPIASVSMTAEIPSPSWMPTMAVVLHEPTGGGGCVADIDGKQIQLTTAQHELMAVLLERNIAEVQADEHVRGFVPMSELISKISLDSSEANVRQLVRRVRRALLRAGIPDLIESRHGRGYRLRIKPRI